MLSWITRACESYLSFVSRPSKQRGSSLSVLFRVMGLTALILYGGARSASGQATVTVDLSKVVNPSVSPLIFGGSNEPNPADQTTVLPMFADSGLRLIRGTVHVDQVVPSNTTFSAYLSNLPNGVGSYVAGSVADPSTWNWGPLSWATNAKAQGLTTMANMLYVPQWLS